MMCDQVGAADDLIAITGISSSRTCILLILQVGRRRRRRRRRRRLLRLLRLQMLQMLPCAHRYCALVTA